MPGLYTSSMASVATATATLLHPSGHYTAPGQWSFWSREIKSCLRTITLNHCYVIPVHSHAATAESQAERLVRSLRLMLKNNTRPRSSLTVSPSTSYPKEQSTIKRNSVLILVNNFSDWIDQVIRSSVYALQQLGRFLCSSWCTLPVFNTIELCPDCPSLDSQRPCFEQSSDNVLLQPLLPVVLGETARDSVLDNSLSLSASKHLHTRCP